jgi:DNA-directed RNA polymerase specialized sigma subunit
MRISDGQQGGQSSTFETMLKTIKEILRDFGRPPKLSRADQLLLTLMYWLEYRTEFHIALTYGISESAVCQTIQKIENALIKSEQFHLPGRKCLQSGGMVLDCK